MAITDLGNIVVVFDLDDTLYAEQDYQTSGIKAVCDTLLTLYGLNITNELLAARDKGIRDLWGEACALLKLPHSASESMLWTYRLHSPDIRLAEGASALVALCKQHSKQVAILTDGRAATQRLKLQALGLSDVPSYISEEHASNKPDDKRFRLIMADYPADHYVYIADNPVKDFIAPNALGWHTIGLAYRDGNIHPYTLSDIPLDALPSHWVESLNDVEALLAAI
jgi:putative hydrolase of the HAD superfamily